MKKLIRLAPGQAGPGPAHLAILLGGLTALALAGIALSGCSQPPARPAEAPARLTIQFGAPSARGFAPAGAAVARVRVEAKGPGGLTSAADSAADAPVRLELAPGAWVLTGKAFSASEVEVASGTLELKLAAGEERSATLRLYPNDGTGSVLLSWSIKGEPGGTLAVQGLLSGPKGAKTPISAEAGQSSLRFESLAAGSWTLELRLEKDGGPLCGLADSVLVAAGMETSVTVTFEPPVATLGLQLGLPSFVERKLDLRPPMRRTARGQQAVFRAGPGGLFSWYQDGRRLAPVGPELSLAAASAGLSRIDCVEGGETTFAASNKAGLLAAEPPAFGPLSWVETIAREDADVGSASAARALSGLRDVTWAPDGSALVVAGRDSNAISVFDRGAGASAFVRCSLGGSAEPRLLSPVRAVFMDRQHVAAISATEGAIYGVSLSGEAAAFSGGLRDPLLAGAADLALAPGGGGVYVAAAGADAVAFVALDAAGRPTAARAAAKKADAGLESLSGPSCLAISATGGALALGSTGDDAIYVFARSIVDGSLSFFQRLDKTAFSALGSLSDPVSLAFSPDAESLYVLSYYGKAVFRLDRDPESGTYAPSAAAKSGSGGVAGFAYPKRLSIAPGGRLLAIVGGGQDDGLAVFDVAGRGGMTHLGTLLPDPAEGGQKITGDALPLRPAALAFSPDGGTLAIGGEDRLVFHTVAP